MSIRLIMKRPPYIGLTCSAETRYLEHNCTKSVYTIDKMKHLAKCVGTKGIFFCPSTFNSDYRREDAFEQMQILALSFSNSQRNAISFEDAMSRKNYMICLYFLLMIYILANLQILMRMILKDSALYFCLIIR